MGIVSGLPEGFNAASYDVIIVGAGYAGAVCARRLVEACGSKVCVLERRNHIAGNAYDREDEAGVLIHEYGPHIYHTTDDRVHQFLSRFTEWTDYQHKVLANINGTLMPVPFNHTSLKLAFGEEKGEHLYQKLVATFGENKKVPIMELRQKNDPELTEVADYVYEVRQDGAAAVGNGAGKSRNKFLLRDARARLDPGRRHWRGTFLLSALEVLLDSGARQAWRYIRGLPVDNL